jgi:hypothetical protein
MHRKSTRLSSVAADNGRQGREDTCNQRERQKRQHTSYSKFHRDVFAHEHPTHANGRRTRIKHKSQSSSTKPITRVTKRRKGYGWSKRRLPKSWPARAILGEDGTRYLIQWEPVHNGMACEEAWEPKAHANDALVAEWEERKRTSALEDSDDEREDGQRYSHVVNTRTSGSSKGSAETTLRETTSTTIPDISNIPIPKTNVAVA